MAYYSRRLKLKYNRGNSSVSNAKAPEYLFPYEIKTSDVVFNFTPLLEQGSCTLIEFDFVDKGFQWAEKLQLKAHFNYSSFSASCTWTNTEVLEIISLIYRKLYLFIDEINLLEKSLVQVQDISEQYARLLVKNKFNDLQNYNGNGPRDSNEFAHAIAEPMRNIKNLLDFLIADKPLYLTKEERCFRPDYGSPVNYKALIIDELKQLKYLYCYPWNDSVLKSAHDAFIAKGNNKTIKSGETYKNHMRRIINENRTWRIKNLDDVNIPYNEQNPQ